MQCGGRAAERGLSARGRAGRARKHRGPTHPAIVQHAGHEGLQLCTLVQHCGPTPTVNSEEKVFASAANSSGPMPSSHSATQDGTANLPIAVP